MVTTPQVAAAEVAERSGRIAHQMKQQIIGVIENMSAFPCPKCGEPIELFGSGGGAAAAERLSHLIGADVPVLGQIPFSQALRNGGDDGKPIPSQLVIEGVFIVDLNRKSENIGGSAIVTVAIPNDFVERALNATRRGRMVIVANHG